LGTFDATPLRNCRACAHGPMATKIGVRLGTKIMTAKALPNYNGRVLGAIFNSIKNAAAELATGIFGKRATKMSDAPSVPRAKFQSMSCDNESPTSLEGRTSLGDASTAPQRTGEQEQKWVKGSITRTPSQSLETSGTTSVVPIVPLHQETLQRLETSEMTQQSSTRDISKLDELNRWHCDVANAVVLDRTKETGKAYSSLSGLLTPRPELSGGPRVATKHEISQAAVFRATLIKDLVKTGMSLPEAQEAFHRKSIELLNQQDWPVIEKTLEFANGKFTSRQTPAAHIPALAGSYRWSNLKGVCSSERDQPNHAVNLLKTELHDEKSGKRLFAGVRSGTIGAEIKDPDKRAAAAKKRAMETIVAALSLRPDLIDKANRGGLPRLRLTSTSLMSPSGIATKEADYLQTQITAWREIDDQKFIRLNGFGGSEITVLVEILPFSVGVNSLAFLGPSFLQGVIGGWSTADGINAKSFDTLMEWTDGYLKKIPNPENSSVVTRLQQELKHIFTNKLHHQDGGDPYKLASRLQELAYEIGAVPAFNCKSGKDRTGQCDVEVKASIMLRQMGDNAPAPNAVLDSKQQEVLRRTQLESGSLEITKLNTGAMGLKINSGGIFAPSNAQRTGAAKEEEGLSRAVHD